MKNETDQQISEAYEGGQSIESLGGMVAARTLWRVYGGDAAFNTQDPPCALTDINEWIVCNEEA